MNWTVVQRILGLLLMMFSLTMLPPIAISIWFAEQSWLPFVQGFGITLLSGFVHAGYRYTSRARTCAYEMAFWSSHHFWTVLGTFGAAPFLFSEFPAMSITDADI